MVALAVVAVMRPGRYRWVRGAAECAEVAEPLPLSVPEIRRLLAALAWRLAPDPNRVMGWSLWRRRHQARARRCHWRRDNDPQKCGCGTNPWVAGSNPAGGANVQVSALSP